MHPKLGVAGPAPALSPHGHSLEGSGAPSVLGRIGPVLGMLGLAVGILGLVYG